MSPLLGSHGTGGFKLTITHCKESKRLIVRDVTQTHCMGGNSNSLLLIVRNETQTHYKGVKIGDSGLC